MKNSSWLVFLLVITAAFLYREHVHAEREASLREDVKAFTDLAHYARDKYQRLKTFATIESISKAEGPVSAAAEQGLRMAIEKTGK